MALVSFNHAAGVIASWTLNRTRLRASLDALASGGSTALYDAVFKTVSLFTARSLQRAAMIIVSDGADSASHMTPTQLKKELTGTDVFLYWIAVDFVDARPATRVNPYTLAEIAAQGNGYSEVIRNRGRRRRPGPGRRRTGSPVHAGLRTHDPRERTLSQPSRQGAEPELCRAREAGNPPIGALFPARRFEHPLDRLLEVGLIARIAAAVWEVDRTYRRTSWMSHLPSLWKTTLPSGRIAMTNGWDGFHFAPKAVWSPATSADENCLFGLPACCLARNACTSADLAGASTDTVV